MREANVGAGPGSLWHVALSFASAQRDYVEQVAEVLRARGVRCFYDADEQIDLWGKYLAEELPAIYGGQAASVVMFVSAEYAARDWTRLERQAALARAVRERREYVLPARFDGTLLPGLPPDMVWIDLNGRRPQDFAAMIARKLAALAIVTPSPSADAESPAPDGKSGQPAGGVPAGGRSAQAGANLKRRTRLLDDALRAARAISHPSGKASSLARVAQALAAADPERSRRLFADAERIARSIGLGSGGPKWALVAIAQAIAATDRERARELLADVEGISASRALRMPAFTRALASIDPGRAEELAQSPRTPKPQRQALLAAIATALAASDPDRAEQLARSTPYGSSAMASIAEALAATDPDRAERLAAETGLPATAKVLAIIDPERAEQLVNPIRRNLRDHMNPHYRALLVKSGPDLTLAKWMTLCAIAPAFVAADPQRAERTARSIADERWRASALARVARALADTDPDRAERLLNEAEQDARAITDPSTRSAALVGLAESLDT